MSRQVLPFPDVDIELSIIWGQKRVRLGDVYEMTQTLASQGSAVADLDNPASSDLELRVGETTIGHARLVGTHPVKLEITKLFSQTGLVQESTVPQMGHRRSEEAE